MSARSTLDPDAGAGTGVIPPPGHDTGSLGPSDLSDTGADSVGAGGYDPAVLASDTDSTGTGVDPSPARRNAGAGTDDIGFDRIVGAEEAGLGGGLDQAEEAREGVTDRVPDSTAEAGADPLDLDADLDADLNADPGAEAGAGAGTGDRGDADGLDDPDDPDDPDAN